jgi:hypothetical protein
MCIKNHPTSLPTFLLTKHFRDYDNVFLKVSTYSKSAVCLAPRSYSKNCYQRKDLVKANLLLGEVNVSY